MNLFSAISLIDILKGVMVFVRWHNILFLNCLKVEKNSLFPCKYKPKSLSPGLYSTLSLELQYCSVTFVCYYDDIMTTIFG